jgi:hypothetical protein
MVKTPDPDPALTGVLGKFIVERKIKFFRQIFDYVSRRYVSRMTGIGYKRFLLVCKRPQLINESEVEKLSEIFDIPPVELLRLLRRF